MIPRVLKEKVFKDSIEPAEETIMPPKRLRHSEEKSNGKSHAGINGEKDFEMTSSTPIYESSPMPRPAVSPITFPPASPPAKRLRTCTRKASFTPLAVRRIRRKH